MNDELKWAASDRYSLLKDWARENRQLKTKFFRQYIIADYIVDFVSLESKLIIEVDGAYHSEYEQQQYDEGRTERLESFGFKVIRFTNDEVISQTDKVIKTIEQKLNEE